MSFMSKTPDQQTGYDTLKEVLVVTSVALVAPYVLLAGIGLGYQAAVKTKKIYKKHFPKK